MGLPERDQNTDKKSSMTRRGFMQIMGTGAVGASLSRAALAAPSEPAPDEKIKSCPLSKKMAQKYI